QEHDRRSHSEDLVDVYVGQAGGLRLETAVDAAHRLHAGLVNAQPGMGQVPRHGVDGVLKILIPVARVIRQDLLMVLGTTSEHGGDERGSYAAAHIAHEIDDAGDGIVLLRGDADVSSKVDGHEQEPQASDLDDAQPQCGTKADLQIRVNGRQQHGDGEVQPAECNQKARLELGGEET